MSSTNPIRIKALDAEEFEAAQSNGFAYGTVSQYVDSRWKTRFVYVKFGLEVPYRERASDNSQTHYRSFVNCTVEFSHTLEEAETGKIIGKMSRLDVVLYC
jgi:hypothetical protein